MTYVENQIVPVMLYIMHYIRKGHFAICKGNEDIAAFAALPMLCACFYLY